jgi:hypothetical protein
MKNVIMAVLLIAAIGAGVYFLFFSKKKPAGENEIQKELVIGKWNMDSLAAAKDSTKDGFALLLFAMDSNARKQVYDFQTSGQVLVSLPGDSLARQDTSSFAWGKANELLWKENAKDSIAELMTVVKLNKDSFVLQTKDSVLVYFKKVK